MVLLMVKLRKEGLVLGSLLPDVLTCNIEARAVWQLRTPMEGTAVRGIADNSEDRSLH